jgi:hypothetical protein
MNLAKLLVGLAFLMPSLLIAQEAKVSGAARRRPRNICLCTRPLLIGTSRIRC